MTLRFGSRRVPMTVHWPQAQAASVTLVLSDECSPLSRWVANFVVASLVGRQPCTIEYATLRWVAEHAGELGAGCDRLFVAGGARAARLVLAAHEEGWPVVHGQLLVRPRFTVAQPMPTRLAGAPPATVVCGEANDDGRRYARQLRAVGVEVQEVHDDGGR